MAGTLRITGWARWRSSPTTGQATILGRLEAAHRTLVAPCWQVGVLVVVVGFLLSASSALATPVLTQVPDSPFSTGKNSNPSSIAFSPSGALLATANNGDNTVSVFSVKSGGALAQVPGSPFATGEQPASVAFSPSGKLLATANTGDSDDGTVSVFSVEPGGTLRQVAGSPFTIGSGSGPLSAAFSPSGALLATANANDDTVSVFSVGPGGALTPAPGSPLTTATGSQPESVAFSPSGALLATVDGSDNVSVFSVEPGGQLTQAPGASSPLLNGSDSSAAFSPSGALLATDAGEVFSVGSGGSLSRVFGPAFPGPTVYSLGVPGGVAFSPSGALLATGLEDGRLSVFSVGPGGALTQAAGSPFTTGPYPESVAFSPSGALLAAASESDGTVSVFSVHASKKQALCVVPTLKGKGLAAARSALRQAHCAVGKITQHKSTTVPKGRVISSSPIAASRHTAGTKIALTVSRGPH